MIENKTPHLSSEYDDKIGDTVPFYDEFHRAAIDLVLHTDPAPAAWLDTGCGTGTLCREALWKFPRTAFTLADPSGQMLALAKEKLKDAGDVTFIQSDSQSLDCPGGAFDVITAIQCHHYLDRETRKKAVENCFRMLKSGGVLIVFENILPFSEAGTGIALKRWGSFQTGRGKSEREVGQHLSRFNSEYFPITVFEHINMMKQAGFAAAEILWVSYMQAGLYAVKP